jgi:hypothetical protein
MRAFRFRLRGDVAAPLIYLPISLRIGANASCLPVPISVLGGLSVRRKADSPGRLDAARNLIAAVAAEVGVALDPI